MRWIEYGRLQGYWDTLFCQIWILHNCIPLCLQVSTAGQQSKKPSTLLSCSRKLFKLPEQVSAIHVEFTEYYFPDNQDFPGNTPRLAPSFISFLKNQSTLNYLGVLTLLLFSGCPFLFSFLMFAFLIFFFPVGKWDRVCMVQNVEAKLCLQSNVSRNVLKELISTQLLEFCPID